jgi:uncharacterized metal-binding protein
MPSGRTHDTVTLTLMPPLFVAGTWGLGGDPLQVAVLVLGFGWGSLYLSPDLDTKSRPFYRWGLFRFIWWPYQWMIPHRNSLSHGLFIGPLLRLIYLSAVLALVYFGVKLLLGTGVSPEAAHRTFRAEIYQGFVTHTREWLLFIVGVWLGSLLHIALDRVGTMLSGRRA